MIFIFLTTLVYASSQEYKEKAQALKLSQERYWNILLHMVDAESEIDDAKFFFSDNGKTDAKAELNATLDALFNETTFDDNSTACRFPARKAWLKKKLQIEDFPEVECREYNRILKRLNPKSATLVFPAAHINSPASMFGHTFLRINSGYNSKLLSYAFNYAADANPDDTNAVLFAIKGLVGGYFGKYSLLPYYEKLKEYRDTENRDIWEYDLDLNEEEVLKMVRHIWELNNTSSYYYFFSENCSYNMLWFIESARESIHLREYFNYQVIPLETIHAAKDENIIVSTNYRPSKHTKLLKYEELIDEKYIFMPKALVNSEITIQKITQDSKISLQQKMYILEASIEFLEYSYSKSNLTKDEYLKLFYNLSQARAKMGLGKRLDIETPSNPAKSHRAIKTSFGVGSREGESVAYITFRPAYHDLEDSNYGFLRGTQIEFLDVELTYTQDKLDVEEATILSIVSLTQLSEFTNSFSWRMKLGFDRESLESETNFLATGGAGFSWGNSLGLIYTMVDPVLYKTQKYEVALGGSIGFILDKYSFMSTNFEATKRYYSSGKGQLLAEASQNFRLSQNTQLKFKYTYIDRLSVDKKENEQAYKLMLSYYF